MPFDVRPGDCFHIEYGSRVASCHFYFVISDPTRFPSAKLVLAPMTSIGPDKRVDPSCLLGPGDHRVCVKESFIDYHRCVAVGRDSLEQWITARRATPKPPPVSEAVLARLRDGAEESEDIRDDVRDVLYRQGLVRAM